jgi:phage I-like protein
MPNLLKPYKPSEIKLTETDGKISPEVQILRVGKFKHPQYGDFEITEKILAEMKDNFDKKTRGIDIAFDYFHDSNKIAAGWPKALELRENGTELWAPVIEWTPRAQQMLADKELRYFSPDFAFQWQDPETQNTFSNVLFGGGLTNRPFVKGMEPIVSLGEHALTGEINAEKKPNDTKGALKMDDKDKMIEQLKAQVAELQGKLDGGGKDKEAMMAEKAKLEEDKQKLLGEKAELEKDKEKLLAEKVKAEREGKFNVMLTEGKACVAQKDAFLLGDMDKFISLAEPINLGGKGSSAGAGGDNQEDKILKLAEDKIKADPKLGFGEAVSLAKKELK